MQISAFHSFLRQVRSFVDETMELVDLTDIMFDLVGTPGQNGLSVEQRKRLTIANEMVANPSVMFMDEPTSGLDARAAAIVMRTVRNVGSSNRAVVVTIHQPSIEIFEVSLNSPSHYRYWCEPPYLCSSLPLFPTFYVAGL